MVKRLQAGRSSLDTPFWQNHFWNHEIHEFSRKSKQTKNIMSSQNKFVRYIKFFVILLAASVFTFWAFSADRPLFDHFGFRQNQTAMTAAWFDVKNPIRGLFFYETPEFGAPWMVPFEFPLYQGVVAILSSRSGVSLTTTGRLVNGVFFIATLVPLWFLVRELRLGLRFYFFSALFLLFSPLYLYWSRTFMIESTAVFFGFSFVTCVGLGISSWVKEGWGRLVSVWLVFALVCGILCALVKATTFPSFGLAGLGVALFLSTASPYKGKWNEVFWVVGVVVGLVLICIGAALLWTRHADSLKSLNPISAHLISKYLETWNYGTLSQKLSMDFWRNTILGRTVPETIGSGWVLLILAPALWFAKWRERFLLVCLVCLFLLPMVLFTNLHIIHSYYQYANSFWLVLAVALAFCIVSRKIPNWSFILVMTLILACQIYTYSNTYYIATTYKWSPVMDVGWFIKKNTPKNSAIMVVGDDWSPEVAFYSKRKALYIPNWVDGFFPVDEVALSSALKNPESMLGGLKLGAVIIRNQGLERSSLPKDRAVALDEYLTKSEAGLVRTTIDKYDIYLIK